MESPQLPKRTNKNRTRKKKALQGEENFISVNYNAICREIDDIASMKSGQDAIIKKKIKKQKELLGKELFIAAIKRIQKTS